MRNLLVKLHRPIGHVDWPKSSAEVEIDRQIVADIPL